MCGHHWQVVSGGDGMRSEGVVDLPVGAKKLLGRFMIR